MSTIFSKPETKRQSIYSFIRHKLTIKGDVRKHKTDPTTPKFCEQEDEAFNEKLENPVISSPPGMVYEEEEEEEEGDDSSLSSGDESLVEESDPRTITMQKLTGTFTQSTRNTAALITLSPCALAAANAARQKRQKNVYRF